MKKRFIMTVFVLLGAVFLFQASLPPQAEAGAVKTILLYVPNRVFDILDIARLRLRVGPGLSVGARATKPATVFAGAHTTVWAGLHGPRGKVRPWLPLGFEGSGGAQVSAADAALGGPYYGPLEVGLESQLLILGGSLGVAPYELIDFVAGIFLIDLQGDDYGRSSKD